MRQIASGLESGIDARRAYALSLSGGLKTGAGSHAAWVLDSGGQKSAVPIGAIQKALTTYASNGTGNGYVNALRTQNYGLGGYDDQMEPNWSGTQGTESPDNSGWGNWMNVLSSFISPIGEGIGRAIKQPPGTVVYQDSGPPPAVPKPPGWVLPVALGGGVIVLYMLFKK